MHQLLYDKSCASYTPRFVELCTAVTSNLFVITVRWIKILSLDFSSNSLLSRHIATSQCHSQRYVLCVTKASNTICVATLWNITSCSLYVNRRFGVTCRLHLQGRKSAEQEPACSRWLTGFLLGWYSTLKMKVISSSETSVYVRGTPL
jgi:hypothetical protein